MIAMREVLVRYVLLSDQKACLGDVGTFIMCEVKVPLAFFGTVVSSSGRNDVIQIVSDRINQTCLPSPA